MVCSDTKVGRDQEDISTHDIAYPATTDGARLAQVASVLTTDRRTVVFSTYQSIQSVMDAQAKGLGDFDLVVCDEAHRTTGLTLNGEEPSEFVKVHDSAALRAVKRLYMTATPRIFGDGSKTKADDVAAVLYSMDDEATFGPEFYRLSFGKAVQLDLLAEYKVLIVAVKEGEMAKLVNNFNEAFKIGDKKVIDMRVATKIIGAWKGLSKQGLVAIDEGGQQEAASEDLAPMRRAVAFSRSIKDSLQMTDIFGRLVGLYQDSHTGDETAFAGMVDCKLDHVDGGMNALVRQQALAWLKDDLPSGECRVLSNARCLSEGVDVPALDAVVFFDTRESIVDIVQSVGRVMRKSPGKQYGYIILPVCMPHDRLSDYNAYIDKDPQFKSIWKILKALRAHDESLVDEAEFRRKIRVITDPGKTGDGDGGTGGGQDSLPLDFPMLPIDAINEAVYAAIPKKLGDREYWAEWAKSIGAVAERLIVRIQALIDNDAAMAAEFRVFLKGLQDTLNPAVRADEAVEMLAQHVLTLPVFQALFADTQFPDNNVVAKALQGVADKLDSAAVDSETEGLNKFYDNVRERIALAKSDKSKQDVIRNLYDTFFHNAFPRMAERLGIVYTPVEVVDFILKSADFALQKHFGECLATPGVQILDPFAGTGTFFVRLLQSGLIPKDKLPYKFAHEMHANEIVLLAYYIATVNLETAFHAQTGTYQPFNGMVLTDTFQMTEEGDMVDKVVMPENNAKAEHQLAQPIRVIVGNPPYSAWQGSENDNNQNLAYPTLDGRIRNTYAALSSATNKNSLYDSYIRALRWASDRVGERGIVAFVTNGSFIANNTADGLRKCLSLEYSHLYIFNLRGNARTQGEERRREAGGIFGEGSRTPVVISILVKAPDHTAPFELHYHDIGDYLSTEQKLEIIDNLGNIGAMGWQQIHPNEAGDWINQRDPSFAKFIALGDESGKSGTSVFKEYSLGVKTNRDPWTYNMSREAAVLNMSRMIDVYEGERSRYKGVCSGKAKDQWPDVDQVVDCDPRRISWTHGLKEDIRRDRPHCFDQQSLIMSMYRPFSKQWLYFNRQLNERVYQVPKLFPSPSHKNIVISATGIGAAKTFSSLVTDNVPNLHLHDTGQCFPLYWYEKLDEKAKAAQSEMFGAGSTGEQADEHGYIRRDAITDWALAQFRGQYADQAISKEDIFFYVYGVLHSPEYKQRFASDLKKMLPRVPFTADFWAFSQAGRQLSHWHLGYESVEPYPLDEQKKGLDLDPTSFYRVKKMAFGKTQGKPDKTLIVYNGQLTLSNVPLEAYDYVVNGKSAIEWIMERYQLTTDKASGIENDPNAWSSDPRYIVDLLKRIVRVSLESVRIVNDLPALNEQ